jgi:tripartite-type tricarboxylate transporter receptor subunit TctC
MTRVFAFVLGIALAASAAAQEWPTRPVRFVVPYAAGGSTDILTRLLADRLGQALGQRFVVENRGGAGGNVGAAIVAKAAPDGHTIMMGGLGMFAINPFLYRTMPFDPVNDFLPVTLFVSFANVVMVHPSVPANSIQQLAAFARANPGKLTSGSAGNGTSSHLSTELFKMMTGTRITHVPYRGSGPMLTDLLGGQILMAIDNLPAALPHIRAGRLRALGVTTARRWAATPEIPTVAEQGLPTYEATSWLAVYVPARTPASIVQRLAAATDKELKSPELAARMRSLGAEPLGGGPDVLAKFQAAETEKWGRVVKASGARID